MEDKSLMKDVYKRPSCTQSTRIYAYTIGDLTRQNKTVVKTVN